MILLKSLDLVLSDASYPCSVELDPVHVNIN